jgi:hypothetical protein
MKRVEKVLLVVEYDSESLDDVVKFNHGFIGLHKHNGLYGSVRSVSIIGEEKCED